MATIILTGSCGDNATFNLYDDGLLEILGTGKMPTYNPYGTQPPWYEYRIQINQVIIADGITVAGSFAFDGCTNLKKVILGNGVLTVDNACFRECSIEYIVIPASVKNINSVAFASCSKLKRVIIKGTTITIAERAFVNCYALAEVIFTGLTEVPQLDNTSAFRSTEISKTSGRISVPSALIESFTGATNWSYYADICRDVTNLAELFKEIADSIRAKKSTTATICPYDYATEIESIETGGKGGITEITSFADISFPCGSVVPTSFANIEF